MSWERVTSQGRLVYWKRDLGQGTYLAVTKETDGRWRWALRGPEFDRQPQPGYRIHAEGTRSTSTLARRAADRHVSQARPASHT
jgi:hypothetical protein